MNTITLWINRHPWTVFTLAHVVALGIAWMIAVEVNEAQGQGLSPQATYMRLVPITR